MRTLFVVAAVAFAACLAAMSASAQQDLARAYNEKLGQIILPTIEFRSTTLQDAVEFLRQEGRRLDPTTKDPDWAGVPMSVELDAQALNIRITLTFSRISLSEAFRYVAQQARVRIEVDAKGVHVRPQQASSQTNDNLTFDASMARARAMYPDVSRGDTPLGKAVTEEIRQLTAANDPILSGLHSPEIISTRVAGRLGIAPAPTNAVPPANAVAVGVAHDQAVAASKARVYAQYPELQAAGNAFYDYFVKVKTATQRESPSYFLADNWPERMADECATRWRTMQANANQASEEERARMLALQNRIAAEQAARPTQRNGQPLPPNWIDPDEADRRYHAQEADSRIQQLESQARDAQVQQDFQHDWQALQPHR